MHIFTLLLIVTVLIVIYISFNKKMYHFDSKNSILNINDK